MNRQTKLGGTFTLPGTLLNLYRMGYGAMQLAGPGVWGLPANVDEAVAVLRDAVAAGVNHIDTSDFYPNLPIARHVEIVYDTAQMRGYPVSTKLNNSQNEAAESATPVTLDTPMQARLF